ncbi:hypothetical protein HYH03_002520 [Edaphochlamys debaryana]|uniref:Uncharacterized protein n=1 Tax=Edaphochlamys debaryana TaxID=47281 RepID=A0A835YAY5_9CHLO|nr:hypothetical protein HYH03_002520 [Edaphochlamys debaryana]|eukprot:KAG2499577.1 hypothetical protein HYH03_002520 [Edaphochlamys debaryana]
MAGTSPAYGLRKGVQPGREFPAWQESDVVGGGFRVSNFPGNAGYNRHLAGQPPRRQPPEQLDPRLLAELARQRVVQRANTYAQHGAYVYHEVTPYEGEQYHGPHPHMPPADMRAAYPAPTAAAYQPSVRGSGTYPPQPPPHPGASYPPRQPSGAAVYGSSGGYGGTDPAAAAAMAAYAQAQQAMAAAAAAVAAAGLSYPGPGGPPAPAGQPGYPPQVPYAPPPPAHMTTTVFASQDRLAQQPPQPQHAQQAARQPPPHAQQAAPYPPQQPYPPTQRPPQAPPMPPPEAEEPPDSPLKGVVQAGRAAAAAAAAGPSRVAAGTTAAGQVAAAEAWLKATADAERGPDGDGGADRGDGDGGYDSGGGGGGGDVTLMPHDTPGNGAAEAGGGGGYGGYGAEAEPPTPNAASAAVDTSAERPFRTAAVSREPSRPPSREASRDVSREPSRAVSRTSSLNSRRGGASAAAPGAAEEGTGADAEPALQVEPPAYRPGDSIQGPLPGGSSPRIPDRPPAAPTAPAPAVVSASVASAPPRPPLPYQHAMAAQTPRRPASAGGPAPPPAATAAAGGGGGGYPVLVRDAGRTPAQAYGYGSAAASGGGRVSAEAAAAAARAATDAVAAAAAAAAAAGVPYTPPDAPRWESSKPVEGDAGYVQYANLMAKGEFGGAVPDPYQGVLPGHRGGPSWRTYVMRSSRASGASAPRPRPASAAPEPSLGPRAVRASLAAAAASGAPLHAGSAASALRASMLGGPDPAAWRERRPRYLDDVEMADRAGKRELWTARASLAADARTLRSAARLLRAENRRVGSEAAALAGSVELMSEGALAPGFVALQAEAVGRRLQAVEGYAPLIGGYAGLQGPGRGRHLGPYASEAEAAAAAEAAMAAAEVAAESGGGPDASAAPHGTDGDYAAAEAIDRRYGPEYSGGYERRTPHAVGGAVRASFPAGGVYDAYGYRQGRYVPASAYSRFQYVAPPELRRRRDVAGEAALRRRLGGALSMSYEQVVEQLVPPHADPDAMLHLVQAVRASKQGHGPGAAGAGVGGRVASVGGSRSVTFADGVAPGAGVEAGRIDEGDEEEEEGEEEGGEEGEGEESSSAARKRAAAAAKKLKPRPPPGPPRSFSDSNAAAALAAAQAVLAKQPLPGSAAALAAAAAAAGPARGGAVGPRPGGGEGEEDGDGEEMTPEEAEEAAAQAAAALAADVSQRHLAVEAVKVLNARAAGFEVLPRGPARPFPLPLTREEGGTLPQPGEELEPPTPRTAARSAAHAAHASGAGPACVAAYTILAAMGGRRMDPEELAWDPQASAVEQLLAPPASSHLALLYMSARHALPHPNDFIAGTDNSYAETATAAGAPPGAAGPLPPGSDAAAAAAGGPRQPSPPIHTGENAGDPAGEGAPQGGFLHGPSAWSGRPPAGDLFLDQGSPGRAPYGQSYRHVASWSVRDAGLVLERRAREMELAGRYRQPAAYLAADKSLAAPLNLDDPDLEERADELREQQKREAYEDKLRKAGEDLREQEVARYGYVKSAPMAPTQGEVEAAEREAAEAEEAEAEAQAARAALREEQARMKAEARGGDGGEEEEEGDGRAAPRKERSGGSAASGGSRGSRGSDSGRPMYGRARYGKGGNDDRWKEKEEEEARAQAAASAGGSGDGEEEEEEVEVEGEMEEEVEVAEDD